MTLGEYVDDTFRIATGWLGWSPALAMRTPIPQIELALEGRLEWVRRTNPFGSGEEKPKPSVAERLKAAFKGAKRG